MSLPTIERLAVERASLHLARKQVRRTNKRLFFVAAVCLLLGFLVGNLTGCGSGVEPEERVAPPSCANQPCPRIG